MMDHPSQNRRIHKLDEASINRIAAGEVIERPASVVKELVENSIDSGADKIEIHYTDGGKSLVRVIDNGCGIARADLPLAVSRHATSKIDGSDLLDIRSFGFRGEALASMGAAGRLTVTSRDADSDCAYIVTVEGSEISSVRPTSLAIGTVIELTDLFKAMPSRLKFLRTTRSESGVIVSTIRSLAMVLPNIRFELVEIPLSGGRRSVLSLPKSRGLEDDAIRARVSAVIGGGFSENCSPVSWAQDDIKIGGYISIPTFHRGTARNQHLFVNGRPVKDKMLFGALRAAYADLLPSGKYPVAALFVECDPQQVDVNVHPAKAEVRFRDPQKLRSLVIKSLRDALAKDGHRSSTSLSSLMADSWHVKTSKSVQSSKHFKPPVFDRRDSQTQLADFPPWAEPAVSPEDTSIDDYPLGAARMQFRDTYILSENSEGLVIVDQHAAHERIVYEKLKTHFDQSKVESMVLLVPDIVELSERDISELRDFSDHLSQMGLVIEEFGVGTICIRALPALLGGGVNGRALLQDIVDSIRETGEATALETRVHAVLSRISCHHSIRAGRQMDAKEMNALLREMERTPNSGQCNHGRPTYIQMPLKDIEKLFGRR